MAKVEGCVDVAVVGGGLAGVTAALTCTAGGLKTALIERRPVLGWEATWAYQLGFKGGREAVTRDLMQCCQAAGGWHRGMVDAPLLEMAINRAVLRCGVLQRNYWIPQQVSWCRARLSGLHCAGKSGPYELKARAFIDATDTLDLWQMTGVRVIPNRRPARAALFYNNLGKISLHHPLALDGAHQVVLLPAIWPGELIVQFELPARDHQAVSLLLPGLLHLMRQEAPWLQNGTVTHCSLEPFQRVVNAAPDEHPSFENLLRIDDFEDIDEGNLVGSLMDAGAETARRLLANWERYDRIPAGEQEVSPLPTAGELETEVLVCGGGTAGSMAAIASARQGVDTTLVESSPLLGGVGASSVHTYYWGMPGGLQDELDLRTEDLSNLFAPPGKVYGFHPIARRVALAQMMKECGVEQVLETVVTGVKVSSPPGQRIQSVETVSPAGRANFKAQVVIDSTGDGEVAALAGVPFTHGRDSDGLTQPYSLVCGRLDLDGRLTYTNIDSGYVDATDAGDLTRARQTALQQYWQENLTAGSRYLFIAPTVGTRSSRNIVGVQTVTLADLVETREFEDVIAYTHGHYDNHAFDYENESDEAVLWVWLMGNWSRIIGGEVPYGCLLPAEIDGLLVACRALSVTWDAHHLLRMQRDMQRVGEVAGLAAALCLQSHLTPHTLPVGSLQEQLAASGALKRTPGGERSNYHNPGQLLSHSEPVPPEEWSRGLACEDPGMLLWQIYRAGEAALPILEGVVEDENEWARFWGAVLLALNNQNNTSATLTLIQAVSERRNLTRQGYRPIQLWMSALLLLGRIGNPVSIEVISQVLCDQNADLDARLAALRALGRIGAPRAAAAIEDALKQVEVPQYRPMRADRHPGFGEDPRWRFDLAAAQALVRLGQARPELVKAYLADPRATVRRYARRILDEINPAP